MYSLYWATNDLLMSMIMIGTEASEERAGGEVEELWRGIYKSEYRPTLKNGSAHARIFRPNSSVLKLNIHKVIRFSIGKSNFIAVNIGSGLGPVDKSTKKVFRIQFLPL